MTTRPRIGCALSALGLLTVLANPNSVPALGIRLPDQDAFATARGNAFAATADDPAAVYYNPAGITQLEGANASIGLYGITYASRFDGPTTSANTPQQWAALPATFSTFSLPKYHLALGFGVYSPYGLSMSWPNKVPWAPAGRSGEIDYIRASPVLAYQVTKTFSIAAGAMFDYAQAELESTPFGATPGIDLHGRDTDAGFSAGVLWQPTPKHSLGATYRSATDMNFQGHASFIAPFTIPSAPASFNYHLPQTLTLGYSFRPTPQWNFEVDADWTDWTSLRTSTVFINSKPAEVLAFNWKPSTIYEFGATRYFGGNWQASAGYMFSENSTPNSSFNALVPDSDRHLFSLGVGQKYAHLSWNATYQLGIGPARTVSGDSQAFGAYNGTYEFFSNAISLNLGYHF